MCEYIIFSGGELDCTKIIVPNTNAVVICADRGLEYAKASEYRLISFSEISIHMLEHFLKMPKYINVLPKKMTPTQCLQ